MVINTALRISYDMPSILGFTDLNITESAALTGMEPKNRRLKIVNVHPERDVGHIAFADDIGQMATKRFGMVDRVYA
ncbi:hypothetical protein FSOLCH5_011022 [Fusarium solani]